MVQQEAAGRTIVVAEGVAGLADQETPIVTVTDFPAAIKRLSAGGVEFVVIGGVAATIHGSAHITLDLDILYRRTPENIERLAATLAPIRPYLRGAPAGLPFHLDAATILNIIAELEALLEEQERAG